LQAFQRAQFGWDVAIKLIILEDTDSDGKADNQITFADGLHLPLGFEIAQECAYDIDKDELNY